MKKNFVIEYFDVVLFMKQSREEKKKETKTRNQKKAKKRHKKEERKKRKRERQRTKVKKGEAKKGSGETKGDTQKNNNALFREEQGFSIKNKERKGKTQKKIKNTKKTNKEGLEPSEVALRAPSPDP